MGVEDIKAWIDDEAAYGFSDSESVVALAAALRIAVEALGSLGHHGAIGEVQDKAFAAISETLGLSKETDDGE